MNNIKQIDVSGHRYDICDANMRAAVTDEYDVLTAYTMGDFCIFNNVLYRCLEDTTGAWQEEKWEKKTLAEMYKEMEIMTHISDAFSALKKYTAGKYCIYENTLYRFTGTKEAGEWDPAKVVATSVDAEISALNENITWKYLGHDGLRRRINLPEIFTELQITAVSDVLKEVNEQCRYSINILYAQLSDETEMEFRAGHFYRPYAENSASIGITATRKYIFVNWSSESSNDTSNSAYIYVWYR